MEKTIFDLAEELGVKDTYIRIDPTVGLHAIIAIHSTKLGPALGGCRCLDYLNTHAAFEDAFRLAQAMSYKAALVNLPFGGGKAVLIKPPVIHDRDAYLAAFGEFIKDLNGKYITAIDSGTSPHDMDVILKTTPYVTCGTDQEGDTSDYTATGIREGIEAAVEMKLGLNSLRDVHVVVQGVGHVGYYLVKQLHERDAKITISDLNKKAVERCTKDFPDIATIDPEYVYRFECDVFSPCALGGIINDKTVHELKCKIIAGSANNQLADRRDGKILHERGILYAPDFAINAGGIIYCGNKYLNKSDKEIDENLALIHPLLIKIFERAKKEDKPTCVIAEAMAKEKLS